MGRGLKHLVSAFMPIADGQRFASPDELASLCSYAKAMLCEQKPRVHTISEPCQPVLIFTDGAYENGVATAAAVVITGSSRLAYVVTVPQALVELWIKTAGDQIISQVELWALVSVRFCLRHKLQGRRIIEWIDNEAARMSAIKANSSSPSMKVLARIVAELELQWPTFSWTERGCSFSNPSDLPSRGRLEEALMKYNLNNGGTLDASHELTDLVLDLQKALYKAALSNLGTPTEQHCGDNSQM